ncbi:ribosome biogenesis protein BMS1 homolog [Planococcus citri]|uniref:ribosome biogenesis protein BMS1 homolog n=1 Tax=Planococcus citri TaxID=170843 RepID=UPI0031F8CACF
MAAPAENMDSDVKKVHRKPRAGRKADKKNKNDPNAQNLTARQRNPKAFAINSAVRAERKFRRHQDLDTKKQHIPLIDRTPLEPPPIVVAIVGPPKVGKSTLMKCLIRNFTRQPLSTIKGPVTIVSGKRRRITFIECNNDINSMIDISKIADLVFLMIDGSFGFEMEIFEFLNICQVHGMPKIMGILTHLDMFKNNKTLKHTKKLLKHRFWTEVYAGAKLFYLSGILRGEYLRNEIERLSRFISVMKFRPLTWQTSHSYVVVDRMEDLTSQELIRQNPKCDRTVSLYGYVRGIPLNKNNSVHIPGCGDSKISNICFLPDPCPLPDKLKKRALVDKERLIYAPFSGVGGIVYDKDAVYVELGGSHSHKKLTNEERPEQEFVSSLVDTKQTLDAKLEQSEVQLFSNADAIVSREFKDDGNNEKSFENIEQDGRTRRKVIFTNESDDDDEDSCSENGADDGDNDDDEGDDDDEDVEEDEDELKDTESDDEDETKENEKIANTNEAFRSRKFASNDNDGDDDDDDDDDEDDIKWKTNLSQKASDAFVARQNTSANLWRLVYDSKELNNEEDDDEDEERVDGLFKVVSAKKKQLLQEKDTFNSEDCSRFIISYVRNWSDERVCDTIRDYFITGKWNSSEDANELLKLDDENNSSSEDELFGDFEDLESGRKFSGEETKAPVTEKPKRELDKAELIERKRRLKEKFDAEYDDKDPDKGGSYYDEMKQDASKQAELNKVEFEGLDDEIRVQLEGYRPGMYVRMELERLPCELVVHFDASYPLIVGGLQTGEENIGYVNTRVKKHRWYNKILKTKDPIIVSLGWRRFQTLPIYYKLEDNFRQRMLKYTPEHVTCMANFWGPLTKPGSGFLAIQDVSTKQEGFRIIATGTVVDANQSVQITKKLKLVGEPLKVYRKTAYIKNMFSSALEVAKFEGAKIKTVSGIRGQIKRACSKPEGVFRATFEDAIKLSDIVFCRTWCNVDVPKFYNPVTSLLCPSDEKNKWLCMKTAGQLKRENGVKVEPQIDSLYSDVHRKKKVFKQIKIPKRLQSQLPYKYKPKAAKVGPSSDTKNRLVVVRDAHDVKVSSLLKMVRTNYQDKQGKQRREVKNRAKEYKKSIKITEQIRQKKEKERRKKVFIKQTKRESRKQE